ncbi:ANK_REP_REGION domain-containing protein [Trichonephila clavata]|uniref:ANK_REP_REGION domain-containing protein n=1 Tax=Trichonephila clavata TaxID=2740835 RepID=A0A8X6HRX6_TRICU|nr:ANK_REP_REGION domain-containing protein [Trichonephila clavata]GFQ75303.1 ANK_REP_REGION domain-containing protein [Trichonephila clavata]GFR11664.1 ANK_REP_REGION domain-containing protein [Trichonephila clavata]GFR17846.1 ANK_REP_REGION domain-containing protein [Trichonephila clavata]GFR24745.1 ANK_REP_REGION domain-containing protein [Trichonephila clavata]
MNNNKRKKLESGSNNIIARLLLRTPEQLKLYCKLLDNEKKQDLYQKVLKEMRKNQEINQLKKLNKVAAVIEEAIEEERK